MNMPSHRSDYGRSATTRVVGHRVPVYINAGQLIVKYFTQAKLGQAPVVFQLRVANGLQIPHTSYAILDFEVEGVKIPA